MGRIYRKRSQSIFWLKPLHIAWSVWNSTRNLIQHFIQQNCQRIPSSSEVAITINGTMQSLNESPDVRNLCFRKLLMLSTGAPACGLACFLSLWKICIHTGGTQFPEVVGGRMKIVSTPLSPFEPVYISSIISSVQQDPVEKLIAAQLVQILCNPTVSYHVQMSSATAPNLSQIKSVHALPS